MEGSSSIVSRVCRGVRSWSTHRQMSSYQRLLTTCSPSSKRPAWRAIRLGRRRLVLGSPAVWRSGSGGRRPPLHLLTRLVDACINSTLLRPLKAAVRGAGFSPAQVGVVASDEEGASPPSTTPPKLRRHGGGDSSRRRGGDLGGGRGVMLNICVAEVLLRRSSSQVRRSPLQAARMKGRQDQEH